MSFVLLLSILLATSSNGEQISAKSLKAYYDNNEVSADRYFKGRMIEVKGKIRSIKKDFLGTVIIYLDTGTEGFMDVMCRLNKEGENEAAQKNVGDIVAFRGIGAGMTLGSPVVNKCDFVAVEKPSKKRKSTK